MARWKIASLVALALPIVLVATTSAAWAIDTHDTATTAQRGVVVAGIDVSGRSTARVRHEVERVASSMPATIVKIGADDVALRTTAGELGVSVDVERTVDRVMQTGRHDPGILAPLRWAKAFIADRHVPLALEVDRIKAITRIEALEGDRRTRPVEPTITTAGETIALVPGSKGIGIDVNDVLAQLPLTIDRPGRTIRIETRRLSTEPAVKDATVAALAARANEIVAHPLTLTAGEQTVEVPGAELRGGFRMQIENGKPRLDLDPAVALKVIATHLAPPFNPTGVTFTATEGRMTPVAGHDAVVCCAESAPKELVDGVLDARKALTLTTRTITAAEGAAAAADLGVKEVIGEFTTRHAAGQPRVKNIHRIADLTRGVLISPGQTFSVNDFVGRRTAAKGFVSAPVIEKGEFSEDIGGGVSQFATTLFNAAFFAGLDIPVHKAHSIYISRYPFGREATLAYPSVDLKIHNNSPYGVVIWPTYTSSSITIALWSTRFATGSQASVTPASGCGRITLVRARKFVDGHTDTQKYTASYSCNPPSH